MQHWKDCFVAAEDTRLTNPSCNLRGTGWNRWEHLLCGNPQERVEIPFNWNISNRIQAKDNHRPCIPSPLDPTPALPREEKCHVNKHHKHVLWQLNLLLFIGKINKILIKHKLKT